MDPDINKHLENDSIEHKKLFIGIIVMLSLVFILIAPLVVILIYFVELHNNHFYWCYDDFICPEGSKNYGKKPSSLYGSGSNQNANCKPGSKDCTCDWGQGNYDKTPECMKKFCNQNKYTGSGEGKQWNMGNTINNNKYICSDSNS